MTWSVGYWDWMEWNSGNKSTPEKPRKVSTLSITDTFLLAPWFEFGPSNVVAHSLATSADGTAKQRIRMRVVASSNLGDASLAFVVNKIGILRVFFSGVSPNYQFHSIDFHHASVIYPFHRFLFVFQSLGNKINWWPHVSLFLANRLAKRHGAPFQRILTYWGTSAERV